MVTTLSYHRIPHYKLPIHLSSSYFLSCQLLPTFMASSLPLLLLSLFLVFLRPIQAQFYSFLVTKDAKSLQYVTKIYHGTPLLPTNVMIDLDSRFLWMDCDSSGPVSSSRRVIPSCSIDCAKARANDFGVNRNGCRLGSKCSVATRNNLRGLTTNGEIVEDTMAVQSFGGSKLSGENEIITVNRFLYSCVPSTGFLNGLPNGVKGVLGLAMTQTSLQSQLSARRFLTCFSSTNGFVSVGNDMNLVSIFGSEISSSLMYTPLALTNSHEYLINVKSIKINGKQVSVKITQLGSTKISTTVPYTTMESSIYSTFIKAYEKSAISMNMTRVAVPPVAPFGLCFASEDMKVPTIDLVLQSEMVKWRIHGRNAMVNVRDEVMCLGILDGGSDMKTPIVLGGFQLEDYVVDFDLGSSMLGFSSSLLTRQKSCSDFVSESDLDQSI